MSHRFPRLRYFQHNPSGPHSVQAVVDHATITSTQVIRSSVTVTGTVGQVFQLAQNGSTDFNFGADGAINRPVGQWGEEVAIGDNQFHGAAPLDNHQAVSFLTANGPQGDAVMLAQSQFFLGRWQASVT